MRRMVLESQIFSDYWGGNFDRALRRIDEFTRQNPIKGAIYNAFVMILNGNLTTVWNLITPILQGEYGELSVLEHLMLQTVHSRALFREYKINEATRIIDSVLDQFEGDQLQNDKIVQIWKATAYGARAFCALYKGNYVEGINYMEKAIAIGEATHLPYVLTKMYNDMGNMYCEIGDLEKGIANIQKSIAIALTTETPWICCQYGTLSELFLQKGELDEALKFGEQALQIIEEQCNQWALACYQQVLGRVYFNVGDDERAVNLITKASHLRMDMQMYHAAGYDLRNLVKIELNRNNLERAKSHYATLKELYTQTHLEKIQYFCKFSEALIKMQGKRMRNLAESQRIFKEILTFKNLSAYEKIDIYLNLCTLLILELKIAEEETVIQELEELTDEMYDIAHKLNSKALQAEITAIKAQVWLIQGKIDPSP